MHGKREDFLLTCAAAREHCEQLWVAQCAGAEFFESFLRTFPGCGCAQPVRQSVFGVVASLVDRGSKLGAAANPP